MMVVAAAIAPMSPKKPTRNMPTIWKKLLMKFPAPCAAPLTTPDAVSTTVCPTLLMLTGWPCISRIWRGVLAGGMTIHATRYMSTHGQK